MALITLRDLGVTLSAPLFSRLNLVINAGDRIGLVAANGRGKSTLLRCIEMEPGEGELTRSRGLTVGYVEQDVPPALMDTPFDAAVLGRCRSSAGRAKAGGPQWSSIRLRCPRCCGRGRCGT